MEYEDRIVLPTPEGIEVTYTLGGLGSRFIAQFVDLLLRAVGLLVLLGLYAALGGPAVLTVLITVAAFALIFVYDVAFEVWGAGQTPGKRWSSLRVLRTSGQPVGLAASAVRNILRLIDGPLTLWLAGSISILTTRRNQRLGDLAASTIVIRTETETLARAAPAPPSAPGLPLDLTGLTATELTAVQQFLERRDALTPAARARVSRSLADALAPRVGGLPPDVGGSERVLEAIAAARAGR